MADSSTDATYGSGDNPDNGTGWDGKPATGETAATNRGAAALTRAVKKVGSAIASHVSQFASGAKIATAKVNGSNAPSANISKGASADESGHPTKAAPVKPVSHPGTTKTATPFKAATGNRSGHSTVHPAAPGTAKSSHPTARSTRPQHATAKATGGTQSSSSHGSKAGQPAKAKKPKKPKKTTKKKTT